MSASNTAAPLFIVLNAGSGHSDTDTTCREIADVLNEAGRTHEILRVEDPERLDEIAKQAVAKAQQSSGIVIAAGGDGTLNAVAQATLGSGCQFGVIPQGTFNYFGRTHGISAETTESTRALLSARMQPVQVGLVNDRVFLVNASMGLYPQLFKDREEQKQKHGRSRLIAAWAALLTLMRGYRPMSITLEAEGRQQTVRTLTLFVGNNRLQLEQLGLQEADAVEDGKLVAIWLRPVSTLQLLWLALKGAMHNLSEAQGVERFLLTHLTVTPSSRRAQRMRVALDGELDWLQTPIEFRVAPEPLLLLTPIDAVPETAAQ
ncbi:MAG: diacylglycerol/lipid kinase family protein [Burkholderiaceae bacterium]